MGIRSVELNRTEPNSVQPAYPSVSARPPTVRRHSITFKPSEGAVGRVESNRASRKYYIKIKNKAKANSERRMKRYNDVLTSVDVEDSKRQEQVHKIYLDPLYELEEALVRMVLSHPKNHQNEDDDVTMDERARPFTEQEQLEWKNQILKLAQEYSDYEDFLKSAGVLVSYEPFDPDAISGYDDHNDQPTDSADCLNDLNMGSDDALHSLEQDWSLSDSL